MFFFFTSTGELLGSTYTVDIERLLTLVRLCGLASVTMPGTYSICRCLLLPPALSYYTQVATVFYLREVACMFVSRLFSVRLFV